MDIINKSIYEKATDIIKKLYGSTAYFRKGQYEAIEATLLNNRTLVIQRTGWGKSLVYFTCTKLLREMGKGVTLVVSPLLVLMERQIEAAKKLGLKCDALNSTVKKRRIDIINSLINDDIDLILITPETLFKDDIQQALKNIKIGLFVIDEAHCISDWGHDFRMEYGNIYKILKIMPLNVPILATTATANDRVVLDIKRQLGDNVYIFRGHLMRKSLSIQVIKLKNKVERYGWILQNINKLPGSGIIYCLTQRDCDYLADFLFKNGVKVMSYYSRDENEEYKNKDAEQLFMDNNIKALVATVKLGMGYDKGDIAFIIHFQQPANIVSYYQQIGRAGRNINRAYTFLMSGIEDKDINDYFINTAFPTKEEAYDVIDYISDNNGTTLSQINAWLNYKKSRIDKALSFLLNEGFIMKEKLKYYSTLKEFKYNDEHYSAIKEIRIKEQNQMYELIETNDCYSKFVVNCLDDKTNESCGICKNCLGYEEFSINISNEYLDKALEYIERLIITIEPRKKWAITAYTKQTKIEFQNQIGICLSKYGDIGYGALVKRDKYSKKNRFCDELVGKSASIVKPMLDENNIKTITCVPSLRSNIVVDFAKRLADSCEVKFIMLLQKFETPKQKLMQNSSHQCENAIKSFSVINDVEIPKNILLIDDVVDSKWTLTICGNELMKAGCEKVFPFALADSSQKED